MRVRIYATAEVMVASAPIEAETPNHAIVAFLAEADLERNLRNLVGSTAIDNIEYNERIHHVYVEHVDEHGDAIDLLGVWTEEELKDLTG